MEIQYGDKTFPVKNATKPLMNYHKGSSWDVFSNFVNDEPTDFFLDTTWGRFSYFETNGKWYRLSIFDVDITQCAHNISSSHERLKRRNNNQCDLFIVPNVPPFALHGHGKLSTMRTPVPYATTKNSLG